MNNLAHKTIYLGVAAMVCPLVTFAKQPKQPNLVIIMADQWRGQALGYLGIEPVITPNIDRLAAEGVSFENAVSSYPVSSPARGMLMTGMYPIASKVWGNCNSINTPYGVELPADAKCWSDVLKEQGYNLGYIGKWHLDAPRRPYVATDNNRGLMAWNEWCPPERRHGFEYWIAYGTYDAHLRPMYWTTDAKRDEFFFVDQWGPEYETDKAIEYIQNKNVGRSEKKPFALVVSMNPPHTAYEQVPDKFKDLYRELDVEKWVANRPDIPAAGDHYGDFYRESLANYYACMSGVDEQVGRIVKVLKEQGLWENTIVVFCSDHGDCMGAHRNIGKNIYYEEAMRVPMIISWPKKIKPRRDSITQIGFADLYPSLLSMMGFEKQIPGKVETFDLSQRILKGKGFNPEFQPYYQIDVRRHDVGGFRGLRNERYTFVVTIRDGKIVNQILFDRLKNPFQMENIAEKQTELVTEFRGILKEWLVKTNDPLVKALE